MCGEIQTGIHQKDAHAEVFAVVAYDTRVSISRTKEQTAEHMPWNCMLRGTDCIHYYSSSLAKEDQKETEVGDEREGRVIAFSRSMRINVLLSHAVREESFSAIVVIPGLSSDSGAWS